MVLLGILKPPVKKLQRPLTAIKDLTDARSTRIQTLIRLKRKSALLQKINQEKLRQPKQARHMICLLRRTRTGSTRAKGMEKACVPTKICIDPVKSCTGPKLEERT
jgi:hypothetical protein